MVHGSPKDDAERHSRKGDTHIRSWILDRGPQGWEGFLNEISSSWLSWKHMLLVPLLPLSLYFLMMFLSRIFLLYFIANLKIFQGLVLNPLFPSYAHSVSAGLHSDGCERYLYADGFQILTIKCGIPSKSQTCIPNSILVFSIWVSLFEASSKLSAQTWLLVPF